jgi:predicted enzyme related to lactoylglutathione lyase
MIHFGFTKLVVDDLERCGRFYAEVFGVQEQYRVHGHLAGRPMDEILYGATAPGGGSFILLRFADGVGDTSAPGGVIPGFVTDDIEALIDRGVEAGGSVAQAVADAPEHGVRVGVLADPEGRLIEVVQPLEREAPA